VPGNSRGGRSQAARGYRIENDREVQQLVDLLLDAHDDLRQGGPAGPMRSCPGALVAAILGR
jgi:hypothetical protein